MKESTFVCHITLSTGETIEIRRLENGGLVGLDGSFLEQIGENEHLYSPFDGKPFNVPLNEVNTARE